MRARGEMVWGRAETAMDPAGAHSGSQHRVRMYPVVPGAPFRLEEQSVSVAFVQEPPVGAAVEPRVWEEHGMGVLPWLSGVHIPVREAKAWSPAPCALPELASLCPWCRVGEHILCKPKNWCCRTIFLPEQRVHFVTG